MRCSSTARSVAKMSSSSFAPMGLAVATAIILSSSSFECAMVVDLLKNTLLALASNYASAALAVNFKTNLVGQAVECLNVTDLEKKQKMFLTWQNRCGADFPGIR